MPEMNGYEVCRLIRADPRFVSLPVVMVTALDAKDERIKGLDAGADDFLSKPINQPELLARVRSLLRIKRLHDQTRRQASELAEWAATLELRVARGVADGNPQNHRRSANLSRSSLAIVGHKPSSSARRKSE